MRADLHLHSVCSDGKYSPYELVRRVKEAGVELFSLTDHDTMEGSEEARAAAREFGLSFVRGWEISAYENGSKLHILGYGCEANGRYENFLQRRIEGGILRARTMLKNANAFYGLHLTMDDITPYHVRVSSPIHTMHVVRAFAMKLCRTPSEIYVEAFVRGKPAFTEEGRPSPEEAIDIIHGTGGKAVLAHPGRVLCLSEEEETEYYRNTLRKGEIKAKSDRARDELLRRLADEGLDGIECFYTTHTAEETERFAAFARERGLIRTGGSDFHAEGGRAKVGQPPFEADETLYSLLSGRGE